MVQLKTIEQLTSFLSENPHSVVFKHSTSCSVSAKAYQEFLSFTSTSPVPSAVIHVVESRKISNYLAKFTGVPHQSPQVLTFCKDKCCDSFSHYLITADRIMEVTRRDC